MAIARNGNSVYVDTTGAATGTETDIRLAGIVFTSDAAADELVLKNGDTSGALKISVKAALADETVHVDLSSTPITFPDGIFVATCTSGAKATLIIKRMGSGA